MSEILHGKQLAQTMREKIAKQLKKKDAPLGLAAILVGKNPASKLYVSLKEKAAKEVGMYFERFEFDEDVSNEELIDKITELNERNDIHGILVQFPLKNQDENLIIAALDPKKDIDGFHTYNRRRWGKENEAIFPPVALAIEKLIKASLQPLEGKTAVIISNSKILAEPVKVLMKENGIIAKRHDKDAPKLKEKTLAADIIIVAVGEADFLTANMIKEGAIIIDVGTNRKEGKNVGDAAKDVHTVAGFVSPVPGGVGPLTVAFLLKNVVEAAELQSK